MRHILYHFANLHRSSDPKLIEINRHIYIRFKFIPVKATEVIGVILLMNLIQWPNTKSILKIKRQKTHSNKDKKSSLSKDFLYFYIQICVYCYSELQEAFAFLKNRHTFYLIYLLLI